ncbi:MAG: membrane protein insertion efficiency factor YidD [Pseudomonadota bacterium]|nr:membrane protein insertion efficiency factor YidD [Pseudomonadota bacterium]
MPVLRLLAAFAIRCYQLFVSPWLGTCCRYQPSCSHYAEEAISRHGLISGGWMTVKRLLRCRPFGGSGYDPVKD